MLFLNIDETEREKERKIGNRENRENRGRERLVAIKERSQYTMNNIDNINKYSF